MHPRHPILLSLALVLAMAAGPAARAGGLQPERPLSGPGPWTSFHDCLADIRLRGSALPDWVVHSCPLVYAARKPSFDATGHPVLDSQGEQANTPVTLSGRVFFPPAWRLPDGAQLPLVVYSHATELKKDAVPSVFGGKEWMLGAAAAVWFGFAVAMPDLPGAGVDAASFHPYCNAKALAYAVVDSIPAIRHTLQADPYLAGHNYGWDGTLYLMGYSEGGYTTLATVKEMETHAGQYAPLTGSACMAGPFDLSGAMRETFIDPVQGYPRSYYLPYFVLGYHAVYGPRMNPMDVFAPILLESEADGNILTWADGAQDGRDVDVELGQRLDQPADSICLRNMFNPPWLAGELADPAYAGSDTHALLAENDLCRGWRPTRPILFRYSTADVNVPCANTLTTLDQLGQEILRSGGDPGKVLFPVPIGQAGDQISHTEGALIAIPSAFAWFHAGMPGPETFARLHW